MDRESETDAIGNSIEAMDPDGWIDTCEEWARWRFRGLVCCLALAGFGKVRVTAGRRSFEQQVRLYGQGRSADEMAVIGLSGHYAKPAMDRVTWLQPHSSRHVAGAAIDVDLEFYDVESYGLIGDICRQLGITWGGEWSVRDFGHFEC